MRQKTRLFPFVVALPIDSLCLAQGIQVKRSQCEVLHITFASVNNALGLLQKPPNSGIIGTKKSSKNKEVSVVEILFLQSAFAFSIRNFLTMKTPQRGNYNKSKNACLNVSFPGGNRSAVFHYFKVK